MFSTLFALAIVALSSVVSRLSLAAAAFDDAVAAFEAASSALADHAERHLLAVVHQTLKPHVMPGRRAPSLPCFIVPLCCACRVELEGAIFLARDMSEKAFPGVHAAPAAQGREAADDWKVDVRQQPEEKEYHERAQRCWSQQLVSTSDQHRDDERKFKEHDSVLVR